MDFVVVGPEKTGTGWIDSALRKYLPHALPAVTKETFYLDRLYHLGPRWHASLYAGDPSLRGEVSPSYFARPIARERLATINPNARIVAVLRDPYARMASHLLHIMRRGAGDLRALDLGLPAALWAEARESSRYAAHGRAWRAAFGAEGVKFVRYDDITLRPASLLRQLAVHVGAQIDVDAEWIAAFSRTRVFESAAPSAPGLARLAYSLSRGLQAIGATRLVEAARRSGVRKLFERSGARLKPVRAELEQRLREHECFDDDICFAEEALCADLSDWRAGAAADTPLRTRDHVSSSAAEAW